MSVHNKRYTHRRDIPVMPVKIPGGKVVNILFCIDLLKGIERETIEKRSIHGPRREQQ